MLEPNFDWRTPDDSKDQVKQRLVRWADMSALYASDSFPNRVRFRYKATYEPDHMGVLYGIAPGLYAAFLAGECPVGVILDDLVERNPEVWDKVQSVLTGTPLVADKKPTVPEVLPLVRELYESEHGGAGHCLHTVLDEANVDDRFVRGSIKWAEERGCDRCLTLGSLLLRMSKTQRGKLANYATGRKGAEMLEKYQGAK